MKSRTRSSSSSRLFSRKAQFFILSSFAIVSIMLFLSRWIEPLRIVDTSVAATAEEIYIFNNIHEQAEKTVMTAGTCEELRYNLGELKETARRYVQQKNMRLDFTLITDACTPSTITATIYIYLESPTTRIDDQFTVTK